MLPHWSPAPPHHVPAAGLLRLDLEKINPEANRLQVNQFVKLSGW